MQKWNGTLLRKFDDPVEGNASVGTTVVVRKTSDNSLAVIYDVDDVNSVQKNNPFVTDDFGRYSFYAPNGKYIIEFGDGSDDIEITLVDNIDHNELLNRNAVGAHDASAISRGSSNVAADLSGIEYTLQGCSEYEIINSDVTLIESEMSAVNKFAKVVITGDSLSINAFGYNAAWGAAGADYATNNPYGLSSWPHLFRDMWVTSGFFQPIKTSRYYSSGTVANVASTFGLQNIAINQRVLGFRFAPDGRLNIESDYTGAPALLISTQPSGSSVTFKVNGVDQTSISTSGHYKGYEFKLIPFSGNLATITDVVNPSGGNADLLIYGVVPSSTTIPKLTGKGGYTSSQILAEYNTLVAPYAPDIIFYIIGANDAGLGGPSSSNFVNNIQYFIDNARAVKPDCVIVLISQPASTYVESRITPYLEAGKQLAIDNGCTHIDLYTATKNIDPSYWRFDNIHTNTRGDTLWFNILKEKLFKNAVYNQEKFLPVREAILGVTANSMKRRSESHTFILQTTTTAPTITSLNSSLAGTVTAEYGTLGDQSVCKIIAPVGYKVASINPLVVTDTQDKTARTYQTTGNANELTFRVTGMSDNIAVPPAGTLVYVTVTITRDSSII